MPFLAKEPCSVHVKTPGCPVPRDRLAIEVQVALVNPLEVLHQHVVDLVGIFRSVVIMWNPAIQEILENSNIRGGRANTISSNKKI